MTRGKDEEGGLALETATCRRKVINQSINSCLFMYLLSSPTPGNVVPLKAFCQAVPAIDTDPNKSVWILTDGI